MAAAPKWQDCHRRRHRRRSAAGTPNGEKLSGRQQRRECEAACRSGPPRRDGRTAVIAFSKLPTLTHRALVAEQLVSARCVAVGPHAADCSVASESHLLARCRQTYFVTAEISLCIGGFNKARPIRSHSLLVTSQRRSNTEMSTSFSTQSESIKILH